MTIFHEPWWLDAVAPTGWAEVRIDQDGTCAVRWPYVIRQGPGPLIRLTSPPLAPRLGPLIDPSISVTTDLARWSDLLSDVAGLLPDHHHFLQSFDPLVEYWMPLSWAGFNQTTRYSFVLHDLSDLDEVRSGYSQGTRRNWRKGLKSVELREGEPVGATYGALGATMGRAQMGLGFREEVLASAVKAATARNQGIHLTAHGVGGGFLAGAVFVWDTERLYYLMGGASDDARGTGAQTLLLDRGIELASELELVFDFEGSAVRSIEKFFRSFGAVPEPYSRVERRTPGLNVLMSIREVRKLRRQTKARSM